MNAEKEQIMVLRDLKVGLAPEGSLRNELSVSLLMLDLDGVDEVHDGFREPGGGWEHAHKPIKKGSLEAFALRVSQVAAVGACLRQRDQNIRVGLSLLGWERFWGDPLVVPRLQIHRGAALYLVKFASDTDLPVVVPHVFVAIHRDNHVLMERCYTLRLVVDGILVDFHLLFGCVLGQIRKNCSESCVHGAADGPVVESPHARHKTLLGLINREGTAVGHHT